MKGRDDDIALNEYLTRYIITESFAASKIAGDQEKVDFIFQGFLEQLAFNDKIISNKDAGLQTAAQVMEMIFSKCNFKNKNAMLVYLVDKILAINPNDVIAKKNYRAAQLPEPELTAIANNYITTMFADFFVSMDEYQRPHPQYPQALIDIYTLPQTYRQIILASEEKESKVAIEYAKKCCDNYKEDISNNPEDIYTIFNYLAIERNMFILNGVTWLPHMAELFVHLDLDLDKTADFCANLPIALVKPFQDFVKQSRENKNIKSEKIQDSALRADQKQTSKILERPQAMKVEGNEISAVCNIF